MARNLELWRPGFLTSSDPFRELRRFQREMDRMRDDLIENLNIGGSEPLMPRGFEFSPSCDLEETPSHYLIAVDLPGVSKEDIKIQMIDHQLKITGEKKREKKEETAQSFYQERSYGRFERVLDLGENIKADKIEANFEEGVLRVTVPKKEETQPKSQPIKIGEGKPSLWHRLTGKSDEKTEPTKKVA
ncbi:MAG: Hsp20/alpha crystallin family protein [Proteobacteria bacterium]|nr:Hsp20/alpha crystallin family protein [Pseudomonadota bacterium]